MLVVVACLLAVLSPLVVGRWPARLALHRWRWAFLLWSTLALQVVAIQAPLPRAVAAVVHVATYGVAVAFLVANRVLPGVLVVAAGALTNGLTIALNGGVLPASRAAAEAAGATTEAAFANSGVLERPVALWLGDVFAWPEPLPLANTFSIGDVLIVLGAALVTWNGTQRLGRGPRLRPHPAAQTSGEGEEQPLHLEHVRRLPTARGDEAVPQPGGEDREPGPVHRRGDG